MFCPNNASYQLVAPPYGTQSQALSNLPDDAVAYLSYPSSTASPAIVNLTTHAGVISLPVFEQIFVKLPAGTSNIEVFGGNGGATLNVVIGQDL